MMLDKTTILEVLSHVIDPQSGQDLVSMNQVENLKIEGFNVDFDLVLQNVNDPIKSAAHEACIEKIQAIYPTAQIHLHFTNTSNQFPLSNKNLPQIKHNNMTHITMKPCIGVKDTACIDVCPVDCIYGADENWEQTYIHSEECIDF